MPRKRKSDKEKEADALDAVDSLDGDAVIPTEESEPEPIPEIPETKEPEPVPEVPEPEPLLPKIQLRVFEKIAGPKWDQLAGFKLYAKKQGLGPMTVPEWREAFQAFKNKPTN